MSWNKLLAFPIALSLVCTPVHASSSVTIVSGSAKTYMSYKALTRESSPQYKLQQIAETDDLGFRKVADRYLIAIGTGYDAPVGTCVDIHMEDDKILECAVGDIKSDAHTDPKHLKGAKCRDIVEFIVDTAVFKDTGCRGNVNTVPCMEGKITAVEVLEDDLWD